MRYTVYERYTSSVTSTELFACFTHSLLHIVPDIPDYLRSHTNSAASDQSDHVPAAAWWRIIHPRIHTTDVKSSYNHAFIQIQVPQLPASSGGKPSRHPPSPMAQVRPNDGPAAVMGVAVISA